MALVDVLDAKTEEELRRALQQAQLSMATVTRQATATLAQLEATLARWDALLSRLERIVAAVSVAGSTGAQS